MRAPMSSVTVIVSGVELLGSSATRHRETEEWSGQRSETGVGGLDAVRVGRPGASPWFGREGYFWALLVVTTLI